MSQFHPEYPQASTDWQAYQPYPYVPTPAHYEVVARQHDLDATTAEALGRMVEVFCGEAPPETYRQLPRMGRMCFTPLLADDTAVLAAKGAVGRSPGAESVGRLQTEHRRSLLGDVAGWEIIDVTDEVAFMILYQPSQRYADQSKKVGAPVPELTYAMPAGYAPFKQLFREYCTTSLFKGIGIRVPAVPALLRREISLPWSTGADAKAFLTAAFAKRQGLARAGVIPQEAPTYSPSARLDTGFLFRRFESAVRPQDHYDKAIEGEWNQVRAALDAAPYSAEDLLSHFAAAAGKLAENGIIHGQIFYDYQNLTTAGELCDLEVAVVAPSANPALARQFTAGLQQGELRLGISLMDHYNSNLERVAPDAKATGRSLLEQAYYLFDATVRGIDIARRAFGRATDRDVPGTVLDSVYIDELRRRFVTEMASNMSDHGRDLLALACKAEVDVDTDFRVPESPPFLKWLLETPGSWTIYGWSDPSRPFDPHGVAARPEDVEAIIRESELFNKTVSDHFNS